MNIYDKMAHNGKGRKYLMTGIFTNFAFQRVRRQTFGHSFIQQAMEEQATEKQNHTGRFAPSPSGRMHLGNIFTALVSWLSARSAGDKWILRIEDLDPQRSRIEHAVMIEDDLDWLGLDFDEGGSGDKGEHGPYLQSLRHDLYEEAYRKIEGMGMVYPCRCTRADIMATQAPHQTDGRVVYPGRCRPAAAPPFAVVPEELASRAASRLFVPDREIRFTDIVAGEQRFNLAREVGDFVLRRADGAWAYQLAVVVDDAFMGVGEVVRGNDLLLSAAQQTYLYELLGLKAPRFAHLPLICNAEGRRLSKRDGALSMENLRRTRTPEQLTGELAFIAGLIPKPEPCHPQDLVGIFDWKLIPRTPTVILDEGYGFFR